MLKYGGVLKYGLKHMLSIDLGKLSICYIVEPSPVVFLSCSSFQLIVKNCQWPSRAMILRLPRDTTSYYLKIGHKPHEMWPPDWRDKKRYDPQIQHVCRWASRCMTPKLPTDLPRIFPHDSIHWYVNRIFYSLNAFENGLLMSLKQLSSKNGRNNPL